MNIKNGIPFTDKDDAVFQLEGNNFYGAINDFSSLIGGQLIKEEVDKDGKFYLLFEWKIRCNDSKLNAVVKVPYYYNNNNEVPKIEELLDIAKEAAINATNFLNNELEERRIKIMPRDIRELGIEDRRVIEGILINSPNKFVIL